MSNTMSLIGGLNQYTGFVERYQSEESPFGRKVFFLQENGYEIHLERAKNYFKKGDVLTVKEIYVDRSSSQVEFVEYPNLLFNTVMFADVKDEVVIEAMERASEVLGADPAYFGEEGAEEVDIQLKKMGYNLEQLKRVDNQ